MLSVCLDRRPAEDHWNLVQRQVLPGQIRGQVRGVLYCTVYCTVLYRCGVYWPFQKERNTPVECNSDESHTPGDGRVGGEGVESSASKKSIRRFVITEKAPTRASS